jgi:hypothetical protein
MGGGCRREEQPRCQQGLERLATQSRHFGRKITRHSPAVGRAAISLIAATISVIAVLPARDKQSVNVRNDAVVASQ